MTIISQGKRFELISYGNGAAYCLRDKPAKMSIVTQYGDDSAVFRNDFDAIESARPDDPNDSVLGELWDWYGDVAQED
jgi:hypothetical protein